MGKGKLTVILDKYENLVDIDLAGKSDPYVKLDLKDEKPKDNGCTGVCIEEKSKYPRIMSKDVQERIPRSVIRKINANL